MNILIVDDKTENTNLLKRILNKIGYNHVYTAQSAKESFEILDEKEIHLIYMDIIMPQMNGIEATREIRKRKNTSEIPIIMVTASSEKEHIKESFAAGANDFVRKPVDLSELKARTNLILKIKTEMDKRKKREEQINNDLYLAKNVQRSVLSKPICEDNIDIDVFYEPSDSVGGDMYGWYEIEEGVYGVMIYDVMGHGIASSLISMSIHSYTSKLIMKVKEPTKVIRKLNDYIYNLLPKDFSVDSYFITAIYLVLNTKKKTINYVNAGHPEGVLFHSRTECILLESTGPLLGIMPEITIEEKELSYKRDCHIICYTDGLIEYVHPDKPIKVEDLSKIIYEQNGKVVESLINKYRLMEFEKKDDICVLAINLK